MSADPVDAAVECLRSGGLLAYPTETVWGVGADARSEAAMEALRRFKGRSDGEPVAILVPSASALDALCFEVGAAAERLAATFWPGPLTLVMRCRARFARGVAREDGAVGVRCSSHPVAAALARRLAEEEVGPITATSLNRSGEPPARDAAEARAVCDLPGGPALFETGEADAGGGPASTVIDLAIAQPRVLRWGALSASEIEPVLREPGAA